MRKVKSDAMRDICAAIIFIIVSFITWLSVSFRIASLVIDEDRIFEETKTAAAFYAINMTIACLLTIICYELVTIVQNNI